MRSKKGFSIFLVLIFSSFLIAIQASVPYDCEEDLIEVMFSEDSQVRLRDGSLVDFKSDALTGVDQILEQLSWHNWFRISDVEEDILDQWSVNGERNTGKPVYNMNNIYRLRIPKGLNIWDQCISLQNLLGIDYAKPVPKPMALPTPGNFQSLQGYLNPASSTPTGIDAAYAWTQTGGTGTGVTVCDLEYSWNYNHADITKAVGSQINTLVQDPFNDTNHGTAVIGELVADNNGWGTTGICYGANLQTCGTYYGSPVSWNPSGAIGVAVSNLNAGDIILLEQQWEYTAGSGNYIPVEWYGSTSSTNPSQYNNPVYAAIVNAVSNGIHVVEAGGNGNVNTDGLTWYGNSGAIIVGAGGASAGNDLQRLSFSSYGQRFDLQGWGENVCTTGYGTYYNSDGVNYWYTSTFNGTSSASPVVAGALACAEGCYYSSVSATPPTPAYMRTHLNTYGTAQVFGTSGNIGPRPNLYSAINNFPPPAQTLDFGDLPDSYLTSLASNGARHLAGIYYLGASVDTEADGIPSVNADSDDNSGSDDEDGVVFNGILTPGGTTSVTVNASTGGYLQCWIDFNGNGMFDVLTNEVVFLNYGLIAGTNILIFTTPATAVSGPTYARFRFSSYTGLIFYGYCDNGEVEDYAVDIENTQGSSLKWEQLPDLSPTGMDVDATWQPEDPESLPVLLADDFLCTETGNITDIHIWGSWKNDHIPFFEDPAAVHFTFSIHSDIPDPDGPGPEYSMPGEMLWMKTWQPTMDDVEMVYDGVEDWYNPAFESWEDDNHYYCYKYNYILDPADYFLQEGTEQNPIVYWLDVQAYPYDIDPECRFGWKTSLDHWNDDAVWVVAQEPYTGFWNELIYPLGHEFETQSIDLAFQITTEGEPTEEYDFGDAPDPNYQTLLANNGARHVLDGVTFLGSQIDAEADGWQDPNALGDDNNNLSDEDGVNFPNPLYIGQGANVDVVTSSAGYISAWIDFSNDNSWGEANDLIINDVYVTAGGTHTFAFNVPTGIAVGPTFARFRFDTVGSLTYTGLAVDGEVEDYEVLIEEEQLFDFGDAPEGDGATAYPSLGVDGAFPTCIIVGPASSYVQHGFGENLAWFGPLVDIETDGNAGSCPGCFPNYDVDECFSDGDAGLLFPESYTIDATGVVVPCATGSSLGIICNNAVWGGNIDIDVTNTMPVDGYVNVLIDWNQDGQWQNDQNTHCAGVITPEHVLVDFPVLSGQIATLSSFMAIGSSFQIGPNAGYVWVRFSITETPVGTTDWDGSGIFEDGETEDYLLYVEGEPEELDFGDAPDPTYLTLLASDGARHILDGVTFLGTQVDAETDGWQDPNALGDDFDNFPDEDGIIFKQIMTGSPAQVEVTTSAPGYLSGWMDFDGNGSWDAAEQIFYDVYIHFAGTICLNYYVPADAVTGLTFARFRFDTVGGLGVTGQAPDGEVEDYQVEIVEDYFVKWSQQPCEYLPGLHCTDNIAIIADDWQCNGGLVTDIHWWGNYDNNIVGSGIDYFHLSIHDDDPTGSCLPVDTEVWGINVPWLLTNETDTGLINSELGIIYSYDHILDEPFNQIEGNHYWLDICAYSYTGDVVWRWQESSRSVAPIHCSAAERTLTTPPWWQWIDWLTPQPTRYSDMAFEITSCPPSTPVNFTITEVGTNMVLDWDPDPCSIYYNIYSSTDPYATFPGGWTLEPTGTKITAITWSDPLSTAGSKKFYRVTAEN